VTSPEEGTPESIPALSSRKVRKTHYDKNSSITAWPKHVERGKSVYRLDRR
jgi:hypothetical protein